MWQYLVVAAVVALAAWLVLRRFRRVLDPAGGESPCCGCSLEGQCSSAAEGCPGAPGEGASPPAGPGDHENT